MTSDAEPDDDWDREYTQEEIEQAEKDIQEWIATSDPLEGLDTEDKIPGLELHQVVNVVSGKHAGRSGKTERVYQEGEKGLRIELVDDKGDHFFVDKEDIDHQFEGVAVSLFMDTDERAAWFARIKEIEEGYS